MDNASLVRAAFAAYQAQDRDTAVAQFADDFVFTSPQDDHIDKATYFDRCFPTADRLAEQQLLHVTAVSSELVFVLYEYELASGERYRNMEAITVRAGLIRETQVFFGGQV